ncbi:MAG: hypothetical protein ACD_48C00149G0003 [uncultured bacterium]|nr:MAG: hypothetical protein ACD_48C00149G0003 [uncultured bacterium]
MNVLGEQLVTLVDAVDLDVEQTNNGICNAAIQTDVRQMKKRISAKDPERNGKLEEIVILIQVADRLQQPIHQLQQIPQLQ